MKEAKESTPSKREDHDVNLSFLLRAWKEESSRGSATISWRYSLKDLKTRARRGFADLDSLVIYFRGLEREGSRDGDANRNLPE